jgi:hypothetical protein
MTWRSRKGKSGLIRKLMEKGFSARKAERAVNAVFACWSQAIARSEEVELPGGFLRAVPPKPRRELHLFTHARTGKSFYRIVEYGKRPALRFRANLAFEPIAVPPPPPPQELLPAAALVQTLTGSPPGPAFLDRLLAAARGDPASLLRRLRDLRQRGRPLQGPDFLLQDVASLYWL